MAVNGERTNWVYVIIGLGLVSVVGAGFFQLNQQLGEREQALSRLAAEMRQAAPEAAPARGETRADASAEWSAAIVQAIEDGFQAAEENARERESRLLDEFAQRLDRRLEIIEGRLAEQQPDVEEMSTSILDEVLGIVEQRIEEQAQVNEHQEAKQTMARTLIRTGLGGALEAYRRDVGHYPIAEEGGLNALMQTPEDEDLAEYWDGPYVKNTMDLLDPWGRELYYESPGEYSEAGYDLASSGPDESFGTEDDIANWGEDA